MAKRPAWTIINGKVESSFFEFVWNGGFAKVQKQKNIAALHESIRKTHNQNALEVSSKSTIELGIRLGAFSLKCDGIPLENVFQSSKKYQNGGPFTDLLNVKPAESKRDERHHSSGNLISFVYKNKEWPLEPQTAFYDYLYVTSLVNNYGMNIDLSEYSWFTDIEFNPEKSINCQARSVAIYKLLQQIKSFDVLITPEDWINFHSEYII